MSRVNLSDLNFVVFFESYFSKSIKEEKRTKFRADIESPFNGPDLNSLCPSNYSTALLLSFHLVLA